MKLNELRWTPLNPWTLGSQRLWSPTGHIARVTRKLDEPYTPYRIHRHEADNSTSRALDVLECAILIADYVDYDRRTHGIAHQD